jgi:uncharacterized protein YukE
MTNGAHVNPEKLERFAEDLTTLARRVDGRADELLARLGSLSRTWEDEAFEKFQPHVKRLVETLLVFVQDAGDFAKYLETKAADARQIHDGSKPF